MSKAINKLIPELRFPEFKNEREWKEKNLDSIAEIVTGSTPSTIEKINYNGNKLFVTPGDINENRYVTQTKTTLSDIGFSKTRKIRSNSVLFVCIGSTIGKVAQNKDECATNQQLNSLIPYKGNSSDFLYSILQHNATKIAALAGNHAVPIINKTAFSAIKLNYPLNPNEQQKIGSCLSSLDEVIASNCQKLEALKEHKKGLMQNLFPQEGETVPRLRFKEFEKDGDWVETSVEKNCLVKGRIGYRGYTTQDIVEQGKGALVLGGKHIQNQLLRLTDPTFLSWEKYYESPEIMVEVGDIIFSQRGTLGDCAIIDKEIGPATINPSMVLLKNITCDARFLYYILIGDSIQREVRKNRAMGAIPMISQKQIKEFPFLIPDNPKEQRKIASFFSSLDELITAQAEEIEQFKLHKKGLMQGLFPKIQD